MLIILLTVIILLWLVGFISIPASSFLTSPVLYFNGRPIGLWDLIVFFVLVWVVSILPQPVKGGVILLLLLWILSLLGILTFSGMGSVLLLLLIVALILHILRLV